MQQSFFAFSSELIIPSSPLYKGSFTVSFIRSLLKQRYPSIQCMQETFLWCQWGIFDIISANSTENETSDELKSSPYFCMVTATKMPQLSDDPPA